MSFKVEFPEFPIAAMPAIPVGFIDQSWRNDVCPSFFHEAADLTLWIDFPNPADREFAEGTLYLLTTKQAAEVETLLATNDWSEMETFIRRRLNGGEEVV